MKKEYDFKNAIRNPYVDKNLKNKFQLILTIQQSIISKRWQRKKVFLIKF